MHVSQNQQSIYLSQFETLNFLIFREKNEEMNELTNGHDKCRRLLKRLQNELLSRERTSQR